MAVSVTLPYECKTHETQSEDLTPPKKNPQINMVRFLFEKWGLFVCLCA